MLQWRKDDLLVVQAGGSDLLFGTGVLTAPYTYYQSGFPPPYYPTSGLLGPSEFKSFLGFVLQLYVLICFPSNGRVGRFLVPFFLNVRLLFKKRVQEREGHRERGTQDPKWAPC